MPRSDGGGVVGRASLLLPLVISLRACGRVFMDSRNSPQIDGRYVLTSSITIDASTPHCRRMAKQWIQRVDDSVVTAGLIASGVMAKTNTSFPACRRSVPWGESSGIVRDNSSTTVGPKASASRGASLLSSSKSVSVVYRCAGRAADYRITIICDLLAQATKRGNDENEMVPSREGVEHEGERLATTARDCGHAVPASSHVCDDTCLKPAR